MIAALMSHLTDHHYTDLFEVMGITFSLTKHTVSLFVAATIALGLITLVGYWYRNRVNLVPRGILMNALESFVKNIRDGMVYEIMGEETGKRYLKFVLTLFIFILFCNFLGLVPSIGIPGADSYLYEGATATGDLSVNLALASLVMLVGMLDGIRVHGFFGWLAHFSHGAPWYSWPIIWPVEVLGTLIKHAVLAIRLMANMVAGHAVLFGILLMAVQFVEQLQSVGMATMASVGPLILGILIFCIEILVSIIQAYVFTILSVIFIDLQVATDH
jgi:F-type H+-transporting ATPase subunit a